jgi:hypothetical protein
MRCQLAVALSWPTVPRAMACIRLANTDSGGIVSFLIRSQYSERGSPAWASRADTYGEVRVTGSSFMYQALMARTCSSTRAGSNRGGRLAQRTRAPHPHQDRSRARHASRCPRAPRRRRARGVRSSLARGRGRERARVRTAGPLTTGTIRDDLNAALDGRLELMASPLLLREIAMVLARPRLQKYLSSKEALRFITTLPAGNPDGRSSGREAAPDASESCAESRRLWDAHRSASAGGHGERRHGYRKRGRLSRKAGTPGIGCGRVTTASGPRPGTGRTLALRPHICHLHRQSSRATVWGVVCRPQRRSFMRQRPGPACGPPQE